MQWTMHVTHLRSTTKFAAESTSCWNFHTGRCFGKEIYSEAGDDEDLELELIPIQYTRSKVTGDNCIHYAVWQVARADVQVSKRGKVERKENKSKAAAVLEGIMGQMSMKMEQGKCPLDPTFLVPNKPSPDLQDLTCSVDYDVSVDIVVIIVTCIVCHLIVDCR